MHRVRRLVIIVILGIVLGTGVPAVATGNASREGWWPSVASRWSAISVRASAAAGARVPATVLMLDASFAPATLTVRPGTTVRWVSRSVIPHTTTSFDGLWDSPNMSRDQGFTFTFTRPGEYRYLCRQHLLQGMIGTIIVR